MSNDTTIGAPPSESGGGPPHIPGYVILGEIGRGGMGIVYRARQLALDRVVALKVAIAGEHASLQSVERFLREARASARLDHPHIVPVYDSGREGSLFWFTMRFVEGTTLAREASRGRLEPRRAAEVAHSIALALDCAHTAGIVHRDVKPANILIDPHGQPLLSDFGVAKDLTAERLTASGAALGTPTYAAPEQLAGEAVDARTDVYGLGATLYDMLTGWPPFSGKNAMEVTFAVLSRGPDPPRTLLPSIPVDLETICLRAMEREPPRRYPTARALADDLGRFLAGEPIQAHPPSRVVRLVRAMRRHRGAVTAAACLAMGIVAATAWVAGRSRAHPDVADASAEKAEDAAAARRQAEEHARRAEEVKRKAERVSAVLRRWRRLRDRVARLDSLRVDLRSGPEERTRARTEALAEVDRFLSETPGDPTSRATAEGLSGWALWLAGREDDALARMRGATATDPDVPVGRLMEALVLFTRYIEGAKLPTLEDSSGRIRFLVDPGEAEGTRRERQAIQTLLTDASQAAVWGKEESEDFDAAVRAVRAFHEGDFDAAEVALTKALEAPDLEVFRTELLLARALGRHYRCRFADAQTDLLEILDARPGQPRIPCLLGESSAGLAAQASLEGRDPRPLYAKALMWYDAAIALAPGYARLLVGRGSVRFRKGESEAQWGGEAIAEYEKACADFDQALSIQPGDEPALLGRGNVRMRWGIALRARGGDPQRLYAQAIEDYDAILSANPKDTFALSNRALVWQRLGECLQGRGESPIASFDRSIRDFEAVLGLDKTDAAIRSNLGNAWLRKGAWEWSRSLDARESFRRAIEAYGDALGRESGLAEAWGNRGTAWTYLGRIAAARREDPTEDWAHADSDLAQALARKADPGIYGGHRADLMLLRAAWKTGRGEDASKDLEEAIECCTQALVANPRSSEAFLQRAKGHLALGQWQAARGTDPTKEYDLAIGDAGEAANARPGSAMAYSYSGLTWRSRAGWEEARGGDPRPSCRKAIEEYGRASALDKGDASIPYNCGNAWLSIGAWEQAHGEDGSKAYESAIGAYAESLSRDDRFWRAHANTGDALERLGRYEKAVKSYEAAVAIAGDSFPPLREALARVREKLGR